MRIKPLDVETLRDRFQRATPFPFVCIDGFLDTHFAREVAAACPAFESALEKGHSFDWVNEKGKVQLSDSSLFPKPLFQLHEELASRIFIDQLEQITGIPMLLADERLAGGGIHVTGPQGRLDVHVDFNFDAERRWHRRLNLILYLNPVWEEDWGGAVELWDATVRKRCHSLKPVLNRCLIFETSETSFHGVGPVRCPKDQRRCSFATYYYTADPPPAWSGRSHSTIFRPRPDERLRGWILMPAEKLRRQVDRRVRRLLDRLW